MPTKDDHLIFRTFLPLPPLVWVLAWNPTKNKILKQKKPKTLSLFYMPTKDDHLIFRAFLPQTWLASVLAWNPTKNKLFQKEQDPQAEDTGITLSLFYMPTKDDLLIVRMFLAHTWLVWVLPGTQLISQKGDRDPQANKETIWLAHIPTKDDLLIFREFFMQAWHVWVLAWNPTKNRLIRRRKTLPVGEEATKTLGLFCMPTKEVLLIFLEFLLWAWHVWVLAWNLQRTSSLHYVTRGTPLTRCRAGP
ncbi:uncharacterized protein LOC120943899 [Rana temporaria]|uniref:uncharacterized protein LOC120943899 n=1 Tax=Rana temporaria TaxID=8407 RepID=UPI001AAD122F|nr:uncharacterized protein LOC120943899 [Rana temporaria]